MQPCPLQVNELARVVAATKADYDERHRRLQEHLDRLATCDSEIASASQERDVMENRKTDAVVDKKKLSNK